MKAIRAKYELARQEAERNLAIQEVELKKYAAHPKANHHNVKMRRQALDALGEMIAEANAALNMMESEASKEIARIQTELAMQKQDMDTTMDEKLSEAFTFGQDVSARSFYAKESNVEKYAGLSKEGIRSLSLSEAKNKWPELYE